MIWTNGVGGLAVGFEGTMARNSPLARQVQQPSAHAAEPLPWDQRGRQGGSLVAPLRVLGGSICA